jgi:7-carboxy-7-deazaguanine synthase
MKVNEIFLSIQGEGVYTGFPTIFVRFGGCNLRCCYCDTTYAYDEGVEMSPLQILDEIKKHFYKRVCLTGGEPLLQSDLNVLLNLLYDYSVSIETNGSLLLDSIQRQEGHSFVMDMKCPSSGCSDKMRFDNFAVLTDKDEIKFVVGSREDYEWAKNIIGSYYKKGIVTFSPVFGTVQYKDIVEWILTDKLDVRFQMQLHKLIWAPDKRGV